jgi:hypothetical protein
MIASEFPRQGSSVHSASHVLRSPDSMIKDRKCRYKPESFNLRPELSMWDGSFEEIPIDRLGHLTLSVIRTLRYQLNLSTFPLVPCGQYHMMIPTGKPSRKRGNCPNLLADTYSYLLSTSVQKSPGYMHRYELRPRLCCWLAAKGNWGKPCLPRSAANSTLRRYEIYARFDFYSRRLALLHKLRIPDNGGKLHCSVAPPSHSTAIRAVPLAIMLSFAFC